MEPSFSGYVPLVYQHNHSDVVQVLGHVMLSDRDGDLWGDAYLNETNSAKHAQQLIDHGDIDKVPLVYQHNHSDAVHRFSMLVCQLLREFTSMLKR